MDLFARPGEGTSRDPLSVTELTLRVRAAIERDLPHLYVRGELSNFRVVGSGHGYGTLKDERSQIRLAIFRNTLGVLGFAPENGRTYVAGGRVSVYEARGEYQIVCESLIPYGEGAAAVALRQLRERLAAEGLFGPERKRPLPFLPRTIGVATSPTGAALRDVLRVLDRRFTNLRVVVSPCKVQGADAPYEIVAALLALGTVRDLDLILLTRGGGSAEDLSAFNDERVVRAIASSPVPVISAVGHEIDWTLSDLVADLRCSTPSAAAEMVVKEKATLIERVGALGLRLHAGARGLLEDLRAHAEAVARRLLHPRRRLEEIAQRLDDLTERLRRGLNRALGDSRRRLAVASARLALRSPGARAREERARIAALRARLEVSACHRIAIGRERLAGAAGRLDSLSPLAVLDRGYSITRSLPSGAIVRAASDAPPGTRLSIRVRRGKLVARVEETGE